MTKDPFLKAYTQQRSNAKMRGIEMRLSLSQWKQIWEDSGKWSQRGKKRGCFAMCRIGDRGHYEIGNVYIGECGLNTSSAQKGRAKSTSTKKKISEANSGKAHEYSKGARNVMHRRDVKLKVSMATRGGRHYRAKRVITPFGEFASGTMASERLGIPKPTVHWRCKNQATGWAYIS